MIRAKLSPRGAIKLPGKVQRALRAKPGMNLILEINGDTVTLRNQDLPSRVDSLCGSLRKYAREGTTIEMETELTKAEVARAAAQEGR